MKTNDEYCKNLSDNDKNRWAILECYFKFRQNIPEFGGQKLISNNKTTEKIIDDLSPMCQLDTDFVVAFMMQNNFGLENMPDGTISWQIWEIVDGQF